MAHLLPNQPHIYDVAPHPTYGHLSPAANVSSFERCSAMLHRFCFIEFVSGTQDAVGRRPMITQK